MMVHLTQPLILQSRGPVWLATEFIISDPSLCNQMYKPFDVWLQLNASDRRHVHCTHSCTTEIKAAILLQITETYSRTCHQRDPHRQMLWCRIKRVTILVTLSHYYKEISKFCQNIQDAVHMRSRRIHVLLYQILLSDAVILPNYEQNHKYLFWPLSRMYHVTCSFQSLA